ncbi:MAG: NAD(P)/FAD-dependent oxidoreductase [Myxococcales bacterium]|nr:NAD(P)/FAD-dependent oxidoreductase [Myxococcales bacterium]
MKNLVILGAGTGGTLMANKLARALSPAEWRIILVDRDDDHIYQPGLLFVPFGLNDPKDLVRPRRRFLPSGAELCLSGAEAVDPVARVVHLRDGAKLSFDVLIVATGARLVPEETAGLTGPGWYRDAFDFYTLAGATALARRLERFKHGRVVVNVVDMPIKCPVAPLEFLFLADAYFTQRGVRDAVEIVYATPLDGAFTKPRASAAFGHLLAEKGVTVQPDFQVASVDSDARTLRAYDGRAIDYDVLVSVPAHQGSAVISNSGLGDDFGFLPTDRQTLQSRDHENIFALGDATDLPTSKAGSVAHFQGEVLIENVLRFIGGKALVPGFDGHANCFVETGHGKAILIDFNYDTEPLPGRFPLPGIGPFTLLEESAVNHWGKLAFRWLYWNLLLLGRELPIEHRMQMAGKWS